MKQDESYIKSVMTLVKCTECGELYERAGVEVLGRTDETWFVSLICYTCFSKCLVAALLRVADNAPEPGASPGVIGVDGARVLSPVGEVDVHGISEFLASFDGDFKGLFAGDQDLHP